MKESGISVIYRSRARRIEVETTTAMFEFYVTPEGLEDGARFAQPGHDLSNITSIHAGIARRLASEWLLEVRANNPAK